MKTISKDSNSPAEGGSLEEQEILERAKAFAEPLLVGEYLSTGESTWSHAQSVAELIAHLGGAVSLQAASYLVYACEHLSKPMEVISKAFGEPYAVLALETTKLVQLQKVARAQAMGNPQSSSSITLNSTINQTEAVRRMLMAFSKDLRVVLLRLSSRLQTLRYCASTTKTCPTDLAQETLQVFAPLANRLGIWQIKWELEDLSFRFLEPATYHDVAKLLDEKRVERESYLERLKAQIFEELKRQGIQAVVEGRPKHIYSIVKKMRGKSLGFDRIFDIRALRIVVPAVSDCYAALSWVHHHFEPMEQEFDDYIAKPKTNGYRSLHTVVRDESGRPIEIQIRTHAMHEHAEFGVAAHWAYKEAGVKGYEGVSANSSYDAKIAVLRQLLAWERELVSLSPEASQLAKAQNLDDRIYVLSPAAEIVELPQLSTAVDFAYAVHTNLGHRCRGAKVDGVLVPLNTVLKSGQTVEVVVAKEGGPSRDWLNADLGFLASPRAKSKVRAWFNAQIAQETINKGRELVERILQREGKTSLNLEELASGLGFKSSQDLFEVVGKDEFSLRNIEQWIHPPEQLSNVDDISLVSKKSKVNESSKKGAVLVVGLDSLMTQLARCCKPAPPDLIKGFVTRGKGVSIHRQNCSNFKQLEVKEPDRVIVVAWGSSQALNPIYYPVDVALEANDRQGLLRDVSEVFAKERMNVVGVQTQSIKGIAWMTFTVEINDALRLEKVLLSVQEIKGVRAVRRR
ncbi:MAG: bifunctional (p)ppGpp synthetase/guanosine-3',5'-bis(diphosphate) 3'-pyrophosphohydrolase [Betaproteobacteria bacterium]|jgi:GTP pyrophosphokinase